ncbi:hypothetical protein HPB49_004828 [Dermacentor silvarum]|uniref:Uncharacterized protein n=1 Tax=Dermacentor silvarum TaxID=543639 RepID=A0ACB8DMK8_DERSI|nr:hypothetical protein HPB49_004828 [Dermacentor silvarum]
MIPGAGNDLITDLEARQLESTSTMTDLRSSHRMLKTSCIIFLPLGLTCAIAALSLAYIAAIHDRHAERPPATTVAGRHADEVHNTATIPRWVSQIPTVQTVIPAEGTAATSLSPFYDREEDVISYFRNLTRGIATAPTIGSADMSTKGDWLVAAASSETSMVTANRDWSAVSTISNGARSPEVVFTAPTMRSVEPAGRRIDVNSLDNEDINDIGDRVDHGELALTSKKSASSNRETTRTTDLLDLLGLHDNLAPNTNTSRSAKRAPSSKKRAAGHDATRRRYRVQNTASGRASWLRRNIGTVTSKLPGAKLKSKESSGKLHLNEHNRSWTRRGERRNDKNVRTLLPSTFVTMARWKPRNARATLPEASPKRPSSEDNFRGARSVTRIVVSHRTQRRRNDILLQLKEEVIVPATRHSPTAILALDLKGATYSYIRDFLSDRKAILKVGDQATDPFLLGGRGTPQGAVLSPLLFNIALIGLPPLLDNIPGIRHGLYADDITIWSSTGSIGAMESHLQEAADVVSDYAKPCGLSCAPQNEKRVCFTSAPLHGSSRYEAEKAANSNV